MIHFLGQFKFENVSCIYSLLPLLVPNPSKPTTLKYGWLHVSSDYCNHQHELWTRLNICSMSLGSCTYWH